MSSRKSSIKNPFFILFILALGMYLGKYLSGPTQYLQINNTGQFPKLVELLSYLEYNYVDAIDLDSLQEEVITNTLESLDPHSSYIPLEELQDITESMQGNFEGIGVEFQIIKDTIVVISPISGGPSQRQGIRAGDKIVRVDTMNVAGVGFTNKDVLKTLKGDKGTEVLLFIKRKNIDRLLEFNIIRDKIPITSVDVSYMVDKEIGYVKVNRFSGTTDKEFITALDGLKRKGMKKLILDLRSNPGGYLSAAINMVDEFLSSGKIIVYTEGNSRNKQVYKSTYHGGFQNEEVVVLIDEGSASASEIVAGAIQDHDRGIIIGRRTFGKGLVQEQSQMTDGSAFRLTTARYYTPSGRSIQKPYTDNTGAYNQESSNRYYNGELYHEDSVKVADSLKFYTDEGRVVYGGGGIYPDYFIPLDTTGRSDWLYDVLAENMMRTFAFDYVDVHRDQLKKYKSAAEFHSKFKIKGSLFKDFLDATEAKGIIGTKSEIENSKPWIKMRLKAFIARQEWNDEGFYRAINENDSMTEKALELFYAK
ncbi:MAG: S41 family peptidase [Flavobacteriales bacterium]|nr:S41 family peptidase [Flavobacteriales bacterium]